jgi:prevent-host-death family protein
MEKALMKQVNATEFQRNPGLYQDAALKEGPLTITKHDRPHIVMMSYEDYKELRRGLRKVRHVTELSDAEIDLILQSKMRPGHEHLNEDMED